MLHRRYSTDIDLLHLLLTLSLLLSQNLPLHSWAGERKKALDFEEQTVEGMNKRPLDSLNSLTDGLNSKDGKHLYQKKKRFGPETQQTLRDMEAVSWKR
jgi:hypothetical protein